MALAALYNVPSDQHQFDSWAFAHAAHHRDIIRRLYELSAATPGTLDEYVLDPLNPHDMGVWLYQHQVMHAQMDRVVGVAGYNLLDADFTDQNQLVGWIWIHGQEHYEVGNILGLG